MAQYTLSSGVRGSWVDKSSLKNGQKAYIKTEVKEEPSKYPDEKGNPQMQDVAKVQFDGQKEPYNCGFNSTTLNGLVKAFGTESTDWIDKPLYVEIEKGRYGGKASYTLFLIPEGFKKIDDEAGFAVIIKDDEELPTKKNKVDAVNSELAGSEKSDEPF